VDIPKVSLSADVRRGSIQSTRFDSHRGERMAFRPNYNQQRSERDRVKRERQAEKLREQQERTAQRKAARDGAPADGESKDQ
jgi:hypothetical protein